MNDNIINDSANKTISEKQEVLLNTNNNSINNVEQGQTVSNTNNIVNDVSIKVEEVGPDGKKPIIVDGMDITNLPVTELTEEIADKMTDEQASEYIKGFSVEEIEQFREVYGFVIQAPKMSEDELNARKEKRQGLIDGLNTKNSKSENEKEEASEPVKTVQTGNIVFGVRN